MKTKEAIECLGNILYQGRNKDTFDLIKKTHQIIKLLKREEKFEKIVKEISETLSKPHYVYKNCRGKEFAYYCNDNAIEIIDNIKQKYFPKED